MAVSLGAGAVLSAVTAPAANAASVPTGSLESLSATDVVLSTVGTEPSPVLRRFTNVFSSVPDPSAVFFRNKSGVLKLAAGCHGLAEQVQVFDVATGKREMSATPFPEGGGGAGNVSYEPVSNSILAFGSTVKKVSLTGTVTNGFAAAAGTTNVAFARATDSKNRVWCGNYPTGSATRFDPATGATTSTPRVHADAQYVRTLAVDANDNVYAGTGAQNPCIVTWHTDSPTRLREIALPNAAAKGFVRSITAHSGVLFVFFDGADGTLTFRAYDIAAGA